MRLSEYAQRPETVAPKQAPVEMSLEIKSQVRKRLYQQISSEQLVHLATLGKERAQKELSALVQQVIAAGNFGELTVVQRQRIIDEIVDMIVGLGPLESLLAEDEVTEIMVVGPKNVFYEKQGRIYKAEEYFDSEEQLRLVVDRIVSPLGRRIDEQQPIVNARLPKGHRVNVVVSPVSLVGTVLTIRKFSPVSYSLDDLVEMGGMEPPIAQMLAWAVRSRKNIAVCGCTGGGKTTLLNALSQAIPHEERIVTIEDSAELKFDTHPHVVRLESRMANAEGSGEISIRDLVVNALRMRPDRIIVGECRSAEALDMLQAMTTGHDGSLTTLHAGSPEEAITRLVMMVRYGMDLPAQVVESQVYSAIDIFVQQDRVANGCRRVTRIDVKSNGKGTEEAPYETVVRWNRATKEYVWEAEPFWIADLCINEIAQTEEVEQWKQAVSLR